MIAYVLSWYPESVGIEQGGIDLGRLYPEPHAREGFEQRWPSFRDSDPLLDQVVWREGRDQLRFRTELLLPETTDDRPPLLLVLGNPAPHSVVHGLPFSFEGNQREHRFWIALNRAGLLAFNSAPQEVGGWVERNAQRKAALYALNYHSPFRLGLVVYFSMPSASSTPPWAGVAGLRKLFSDPALRVLAALEEERVAKAMQHFNGGYGGVVAFQRDAYEGLRLPNDRPYSLGAALTASLEGACKSDPRVPLLAGPPTRRLHTTAGLAALARIKARLA